MTAGEEGKAGFGCGGGRALRRGCARLGRCWRFFRFRAWAGGGSATRRSAAAPRGAPAGGGLAQETKEPTGQRTAARGKAVSEASGCSGRQFEEAIEEYDRRPGWTDECRLRAGGDCGAQPRGHGTDSGGGKDRVRGDEAGGAAALEQALDAGPEESGSDRAFVRAGRRRYRNRRLRSMSRPRINWQSVPLSPDAGVHSFHLHDGCDGDRAGIQGLRDRRDSGRQRPRRAGPVRFGRRTLREPNARLGLATNTFYVPLDTHRALVAATRVKTGRGSCARIWRRSTCRD